VAEPRPIERVVDSIAPFTTETLDLVEHTAERYVGSFWDVARAAVPSRHARAEKSVLAQAALPQPPAEQAEDNSDDVWAAYHWPHRTSEPGEPNEPERIVWSSAPGTDFAAEICDLVQRVHRGGRGVVVVVPDAADVERVASRLLAVFGKAEVALLSADAGPERRYREFLRARTGRAGIVVGTRNAVFAPVADLGAIIVWDDGDDVYREPHAPYWDAREVAALRSHPVRLRSVRRCARSLGRDAMVVSIRLGAGGGAAATYLVAGTGDRRSGSRPRPGSQQRPDPHRRLAGRAAGPCGRTGAVPGDAPGIRATSGVSPVPGSSHLCASRLRRRAALHLRACRALVHSVRCIGGQLVVSQLPRDRTSRRDGRCRPDRGGTGQGIPRRADRVVAG